MSLKWGAKGPVIYGFFERQLEAPVSPQIVRTKDGCWGKSRLVRTADQQFKIEHALKDDLGALSWVCDPSYQYELKASGETAWNLLSTPVVNKQTGEKELRRLDTRKQKGIPNEYQGVVVVSVTEGFSPQGYRVLNVAVYGQVEYPGLEPTLRPLDCQLESDKDQFNRIMLGVLMMLVKPLKPDPVNKTPRKR